MTGQTQSATQSAMRNCPVGFGFRVCSPYRHDRDCGTPKPGKKKQKRYDYACAVLVIHRFPFSLLLTRVVRKIRLEVTRKVVDAVVLYRQPCRALDSSMNPKLKSATIASGQSATMALRVSVGTSESQRTSANTTSNSQAPSSRGS